AVEAALKVARKATGRQLVVSFVNAFHGMTAGSLAVSGGPLRQADTVPLVGGTVFLPFDGSFGPDCDTLDWFEHMLADAGGGLPAACIVETVQAEGGVIAARMAWLKRLEVLCRKHGILLIVDDIQAGCGRTGTFFSFEPAGLSPDLVCLSKSLSGFGLPLALVLLKPEHDCLRPGEHNGTFRGHNLAFVTAVEALRFWRDGAFAAEIERKSAYLEGRLSAIAAAHADVIACGVRGRGMIRGLVMPSGEVAGRVSAEAFARGLVIETAGPRGEVVKCLCPLVIDDADLAEGLDRLSEAVGVALNGSGCAEV
ncbi:MAG: aminotransferase class III-fold pyridoxal phosphate-dependent enzyme, partial [Rhodospirillaceae bacterium]|nr:aminotransferase class III-fold pyridoxal phosphate-dependent enzyme [Rhodospirillaceae bacterium]